jgi:hypothetical protein
MPKRPRVIRTLPGFFFHLHVEEALHLLDIAAKQRKWWDAEVIHRAAVVFMVAAWQTYVEVLADNLADASPGSTTRLPTPSARNIDVHFEARFGIQNISSTWKWRGMTPPSARRKLLGLLDLRHQISHKARLPATLRKGTVVNYLHFVYRLTVCMQNAVAKHVAVRDGEPYRPTSFERRIGVFRARPVDA